MKIKNCNNIIKNLGFLYSAFINSSIILWESIIKLDNMSFSKTCCSCVFVAVIRQPWPQINL